MGYENCNDCVRCNLIGMTSFADDPSEKKIYISGKLYFYRNYYNTKNDDVYHVDLLKKCCYIKYFIGVHNNIGDIETILLRNLDTIIVYNKYLNDYLYQVDFKNNESIIEPFKCTNSNFEYNEIEVNRDIKYVLVNDNRNMCNIL